MSELGSSWLSPSSSMPRGGLPPLHRSTVASVPLHMLSSTRAERDSLALSLSSTRAERDSLALRLQESEQKLKDAREEAARAEERRKDVERRCFEAEEREARARTEERLGRDGEGEDEDARSLVQQLQAQLDEAHRMLEEAHRQLDESTRHEPPMLAASLVAQQPLAIAREPSLHRMASSIREVAETMREERRQKSWELIQAAREDALLEARLAKEDEVEHWQPKSWVSSLHEVPDGLAKVIMEPIVEKFDHLEDHDSDQARRTQLAFLRNLGKRCRGLEKGHDQELMLELLKAGRAGLLERLASVLTRGIKDLADAEAATGAELHAKFVAEELPDLSYGKLNSFFEGLEGLIGSPNPNLLDAMAHEHCAGPDAKYMFTTLNYSISTFSSWEWYFVYDPDKGRTEVLPADGDWPTEQYPLAVVPSGETRRYRKVLSLASFERVLREKNQKLEAVGANKLQTVEFVASRLYTGPMFMKYNTALRACGKDPRFVEFFKKLNHGNMYTTTLHVINSAIVKLGKITAQSKVYRGISGRTLPKDFMDPARTEPRGGIELGFMSTTHDKSVAVHYAQKKGVVFEIQMGMIDRGADLSWLSQYPHERELLFSPLTGCEIIDLEVEGSLLVAKVRLSVNLTTPTIEQVIAKMQSANLQLLDNIRANVLQANPPARVLLALDGLRNTQAARDPAFFNDASNFRSATEVALSEQKEAFAVLADERLWEEVAREGDGDEQVVESLSTRMWNAALVSARSSQHGAAIQLLRQSMRRELVEERLSPRRRALASSCGRPGTGEDTPSLGPAHRKEAMLSRIHSAVGADGIDLAGFLALATELLPQLPPEQVPLVFKQCDTDRSGRINSAEAKEVMEKLIDLEGGNRRTGMQSKGNKPLFATKASMGPSKTRRISLMESSTDTLPKTERELKIAAAIDEALQKASGPEQQEDIRLVVRLLELGAPQPWPSTLCHLVQGIDGASGTIGKDLVERIVEACSEDRMAPGEEVLVLQNKACNLWKKAIIKCVQTNDEGKGPFYDVFFPLGQAEPIAMMPANEVLPIGDSGAGALLRAAALSGDEGLVKALLNAKVHVYEAAPDGNTALHLAAALGRAGVYKTLMDAAKALPARKGPPAHAFTKNVRGMRAFDYMVQGHHINCTRLMRPSAQDVDYTQALKEKADLPLVLQYACHGSAAELANELDAMESRGEKLESMTTSTGATALMLACRKGPNSRGGGEGVEDKVRLLLMRGANVHATSQGGCVALSFAAEAGNPRVTRMLLEEKAKVDVATQNGMTPLLLACQNGWDQTAEMLIGAGADVNFVQKGGDEFTPIIFAAMNGHSSCVDMLIRRGANVNYAKPDGFNALILAAGFNQLDVVRQLVRAGAEVEHTNSRGLTALLYASQAGQGPVVRALLQLGADALRVGHDGYSAIHLACKGGHSDVVSALLSGLRNRPGSDFDIDAVTPDGFSALHLACINGNEKVVQMLTEHEKDSDEKRGADQRMRDRSGRDAFAVAKEEGHEQVCQLLQPTRQQMVTTYDTLNTTDAFMRARDSLTLDNVWALHRELASAGVVDGQLLSTKPAGFDTVPTFFARLSSAGIDERQKELLAENEAMWREGDSRAKQFLLATWNPDLVACVRPGPEVTSFENGDASPENFSQALSTLSARLGVLGSSDCILPERHRFLLLNGDLTWHRFNVLVIGKVGGLEELSRAITLIEDMKAEAHAFAERSGWSKSLGLYFEPYPHASVNSLYLHIMEKKDHATLPEKLQKQLITLDDVLNVLKIEREVEGAAWVDHTLAENWKISVVCVSPIARNRGNLTLACMREVYSEYPTVINSLNVTFDDRDQDRKLYAPPFHFRDIPRPAQSYTSWEEDPFNYVFAIGGMSDQQGASLRATLENRRCPFAINGTPGFNIGFSDEAKKLTKFLQEDMRPPGIVDDASAALIVGIEEHMKYMSLLPRSAQLAAKQSRVAFPLTARGHTREGAGSYGRQFRDSEDKPTIRSRDWFIDLAGKYAIELNKSNRAAAETLFGVQGALKNADLADMAKRGDVIGDDNELGAILKVCDEFCKPEVIAAMHSSAERLFPILVECDMRVGVTQSKIYDAKLVLSFAAKRAVDGALLFEDGTPVTYATFGLGEPAGGGKSMVENRELVRDLIFVLMSLHRMPFDGLYVPPDDIVRKQVHAAVTVLAKLPVLDSGLMICDTGVDPNEDDLAAIMMVANLNLLAEGRLAPSIAALRAHEEFPRSTPPATPEECVRLAAVKNFRDMDTNGDNVLTEQEFIDAQVGQKQHLQTP